jgi:hypothetical protein
MMSHRARILAAARKQPVDNLPFGARIDVWYNYHVGHNTLPEKYRGWSIVDILRDQGAGTQIRHLRVWKVDYDGLEVVTKEEPPYTTTEWRTPLGSVSLKTIFTPEEGPWIVYEVNHPFRSTADYPVIAYILEHTRLTPDFAELEAKQKMLGEDGLVLTGMDLYSPMQQIMRFWLGYEVFFYELHDHRAQVEHLYELQKELAGKKLKIIGDSPVEFPVLCANWSDEFHTPLFKKYFTPWLKEASDYLHGKGKVTHVHADGEMKRLMPLFLETGVDAIEAWSPVPMTSLTTAELKKAWGNEVTIWGGIPAVLFEPQYSDAEFDDYIRNMFKEVAPGNNFIVGMGDNLPFDGKIERVGRVAELIDKYGKVPIQV